MKSINLLDIGQLYLIIRNNKKNDDGITIS